jgi:shikimate dehydrogenase
LPGNVDLSLKDIPRKSQAYLLDVAYNPWPSFRALEWESDGGIAVNGLDMLVRQALIQVRIFVQGSPEIILENESDVFQAMQIAISHRE